MRPDQGVIVMTHFSSALIGFGLATAMALAPTVHADDHGGDQDLTPLGAIRAGNADGTIPAWTGGITTPPAGYEPGDHHPDPYAEDQPLFTITAANMEQYADKLPEGAKALFRRYPDSYRMHVYPTRRSASLPQRIYDATQENATRAELTPDGNGVVGAREGIPFPSPENGLEAIWNHLLRYRGETISRRIGQANPTAGGAYTMNIIEEDLLAVYSQPGGTDGNISIYFLQELVQPAQRAGEILLVHETINQITQPRIAWTYNPGLQRSIRAPNVAYDNPGTAADGMRTSDNLDIFNGAPDRYEWTLVGRKEMYVPYNSYRLHSDALQYDEIIQPGHINQDLARYELHRVWVVDARLKDGTSHIYARRTFYIDEDSWQILAADHYDGRGEMWRVAESHGINYYEVPTYWSTLDCLYDLQNGRYTCFGFDNQERMYDFEADLTVRDFRPEALRRRGRR